ncbi:hypothetical protein Dimus_002194, partial [Dionaea muscipula]
VCVPKANGRQNPALTSGGERREAATSAKRVVAPMAVPIEPPVFGWPKMCVDD